MTPKQFAKFVERDGGCVHCGELEAIAPQHRLNRGAGGKNSKAERVSNIIVLCSVVNGLIESDYQWANVAVENGWKIRSWQDPSSVPVWFATRGKLFLLDDFFNVVEVGKDS